MIRRLLAAAFLLAASPALAAEPPPYFQAPLERGHPLAGRILVPATGEVLTPEQLLARAAAADLVLLGETHDNPDHHALQAWAVRALAEAGWRPALVFEMIAADRAEALADHLKANPGDAKGLGAAVGWERSGWPEWELYRPIAEAALAAGAPIVAGNLSREDTRAMGRGAPPAELAARLGLAKPLPPDLAESLAAEIRESHCGMLPEKAVPGMVTVQRARDAALAEALVGAARETGKAVLIAGSGHVRTDFGVPWHLGAGRDAFALAFIEAEAGAEDLQAYARHYGGTTPPFDAVWFTPRAERDDPCESFAKRMRERK